MQTTFPLGLPVAIALSAILGAAACSSHGSGSPSGTGGETGSGGAAGKGGLVGSGGRIGTGGGVGSGGGGAAHTGGSSGSGGSGTGTSGGAPGTGGGGGNDAGTADGSSTSRGNYQPTWASVDTHNAAPEWFQDAKFGIYFHWGAYAVQAWTNEWYPNGMFDQSSTFYTHHITTYGDPYTNWGYDKFITGAYDLNGHWTQFAPKPVSQGGNWDPDAWAQLFLDSGARFVGPAAEHCDGFSLWNSSVSEWNAVSKGPKLDLVGQLARSIRAKGLKFFVSDHNVANFNGFYQHVPPQSDPSLQKLYGQLPTATEDQLWLDKLKELVDQYLPDIMFHDGWMTYLPESYRLEYLAYYYNAAARQNAEVVVTFKAENGDPNAGFHQSGEVLDWERSGPPGLQSPFWLVDQSVSPGTWSYIADPGMMNLFQPANATVTQRCLLLHELIDAVSKNGSMVLDIAPTPDGVIPDDQKAILSTFGDWLGRFGEAIYATRAWTAYGEGPTQMGGASGALLLPVAGTARDIRYTRSKDNTILYAIVLGWPGDGATLKLSKLASGVDLSNLRSVQLITGAGTYSSLSYSQDATGLDVSMPSSQPFSALAYALKLTFSGHVP